MKTPTPARAKIAADAKAVRDEMDRLAKRNASGRWSVEDDVRFEEYRARHAELRSSLRELPKAPRITKVKAVDPYVPGSPASYFADLAASRSLTPLPGVRPEEARERLGRHADATAASKMSRAMKRTALTRRAGVGCDRGGATASPSGTLYSERDLSLLPGAGGELSPPIWLLDQFASVARSAAPLLRAVPSVPLPDGVSSVYIPRATVVGDVVPMAIENVTPPTAWSGTDQIEATVCTISGIIPVSQQFHDRAPGIDGFLTRDFAENFAAVAESQILTGTGENGQLLGWLNVPANSVTYATSTPTTAGVVQNVAKAAGAVGNTRLRPADAVVMTPERYSWLAGYPDGSGNLAAMRPGTGEVPDDADLGCHGPIAGLPTYLDAALPQNLGASGDEDTIVVARCADSLWLASDPAFDVIVDTAGAAEQMTIFIRYHVYAAFFSNRYPEAIATISGTGLSRSSLGW